MPIPDASEMEKIADARIDGWHALFQERSVWPTWVKKLERKLIAWLDGETIEHVEFTYDGQVGDDRALDAAESSVLKMFILSTRFAVYVRVEKDRDTTLQARAVHWHMVRREALVGLELVFPSDSEARWGLQMDLNYLGIADAIHLPMSPPRQPPEDGNMELFRSLREDYFALSP